MFGKFIYNLSLGRYFHLFNRFLSFVIFHKVDFDIAGSSYRKYLNFAQTLIVLRDENLGEEIFQLLKCKSEKFLNQICIVM